MTFDEAIEKFEQEANEYNGLVPMETIYELILDLKEEYAPTIEMTEEYAKDLETMTKEVREDFVLSEIPDGVRPTDKMIEIGRFHILFKYLMAILHPETIKIIDE